VLSPCWGTPDVTQWFWWLQLRGWCFPSVPVSCADLIRIPCPQRENFSGDTWKMRYTNQIRTRYMNWRPTPATQLQPSKSLCYIGYTSTWLDVGSCVLMQEATTCNIFYDGISFQHLATVLISVFTLCYGPGLLFRCPPSISLMSFIIPSSE